MIKSILKWFDLMSTFKKMAKSENITFSVVYSLLKRKGKAYVFENIFKIPWQM